MEANRNEAVGAPVDVAALRKARDEAQTKYAHTRQHAMAGRGMKAQLDAARSAYMLAQDEYRAALAKVGAP